MRKIIFILVPVVVMVLCLSGCIIQYDKGRPEKTYTETDGLRESGRTSTAHAGVPDAIIGQYEYDRALELQDEIAAGKYDAHVFEIMGELVCDTYSGWAVAVRDNDLKREVLFPIRVKHWVDDDFPAEGTIVDITGVVISNELSHYFAVHPEDMLVFTEGVESNEKRIDGQTKS